MSTRSMLGLATACLLGVGCAEPAAEGSEERRPQQACQPMDPVRTAAHMAGARVSALAGDEEGVRRNTAAMSEDLRRAMKIPDARRLIDREARGPSHVHIQAFGQLPGPTKRTCLSGYRADTSAAMQRLTSFATRWSPWATRWLSSCTSRMAHPNCATAWTRSAATASWHPVTAPFSRGNARSTC